MAVVLLATPVALLEMEAVLLAVSVSGVGRQNRRQLTSGDASRLRGAAIVQDVAGDGAFEKGHGLRVSL